MNSSWVAARIKFRGGATVIRTPRRPLFSPVHGANGHIFARPPFFAYGIFLTCCMCVRRPFALLFSHHARSVGDLHMWRVFESRDRHRSGSEGAKKGEGDR